MTPITLTTRNPTMSLRISHIFPTQNFSLDCPSPYWCVSLSLRTTKKIDSMRNMIGWSAGLHNNQHACKLILGILAT